MPPPDSHPVRFYAISQDELQPLEIPGGATDVHELFDGLPLGIYEGLRSFEGTRLLRLEQHLDRADRSLQLAGIGRRVDRSTMRIALARALELWPLPEARIRFDELSAPARALGTESATLLALSSLPELPATAREEGLVLGLASNLHRDRPLIKEARWVVRRRHADHRSEHVYERVLLDEEGRILEGTSSNLFLVKDGVIFTAGAGVLEGVTRGIALEVAAQAGVPVRPEALAVDDVARCQEAFLTSASRGLLPVRSIGGRLVGAGRPGPIWRSLHELYLTLVQREARPPA